MAIIGAILGDISGSQYEFARPENLDWKKCKLFTEHCRFTDDTVMTLAAKMAIINHMPFADSYRMLGRKYRRAGYGGMFRTWLDHDEQEAYHSFGNGSAMRCSYIGEHFHTEQEIIEWATKSADCTHNHPEGIKGAVVTAMCIYMARTGASKSARHKRNTPPRLPVPQARSVFFRRIAPALGNLTFCKHPDIRFDHIPDQYRII